MFALPLAQLFVVGAQQDAVCGKGTVSVPPDVLFAQLYADIIKSRVKLLKHMIFIDNDEYLVPEMMANCRAIIFVKVKEHSPAS